MEGGGAYGAGKAGVGFDPIAYIKKPQVILRLISWVFAVIVFGCIAAEGKRMQDGKEYCVYGGKTSACGFGISVGVFAFLACTIFLVIDAIFDNLSNVTHRKYAVIADLAFSAVWCFMWFVCFCYLTDSWRNTTAAEKPHDLSQSQIKAAIAFSFFSVIPWAGLTVLAFMRYRQGAQSAFSPSYEPEPSSATNPYSSFPGDTAQPGDAYQQPPFGEKTGVPDSQYQAPSY